MPPFLLGTVVVAFLINTIFGLVTLAITIVWVVETFSTTCRRCPFYATSKCGVPGLLVPFIFRKQSPNTISIRRVRLHYYADLTMIFLVNFVYWHVPWLFPIVAGCSFIGILIVFHPRKYHGLLFRLKPASGSTKQVTKESTNNRLSLVVLPPPQMHHDIPSSEDSCNQR